MKIVSKLWVGIVVLILLCPLGLLIPDKFKAGEAWGEWGTEKIKEMVGYIPSGLNALSGIWKAPLPDYSFRGWEGKGLAHICFSYMISASVGIAVTVIFVFILVKFFGKKNNMPKIHSKFIERSLSGTLSFVKESLYSQDCAAKNGFLQSLDPRIKTVSFLVFLCVVIFLKNTALIGAMYIFCFCLSCLSRINPGFFLKRTLVFIPIFSLLIVAPAIFSIITPGREIASVNYGGMHVAVTRQGIDTAALFLIRVTTSVSCVVLLSLTTKHTVLLRVLRIFKIPQVFVMILGMCYRYIYLFVGIVENSYLGIKSRVGGFISASKGRRLVAWKIASLWQRSFQMNEEVYRAMLSRGYTGEPFILEEFKTTIRDWVWLGGVLMMSAVIIYYSRYM